MQLKSISIKNFRSIEDLEVQFDQCTALIGPNNAGKSTILRAIEMFFEAAPKLSDEDFFHKDTNQAIEITCTFDELTPSEQEEFAGAIIYNELKIGREFFRGAKQHLYSVYRRGNPNFQEIRDATTGTERRRRYREIAKNYIDLPDVSSADEIDARLLEWESSHESELRVIRDRAFFGAPNVASGKLKRKTSVNLIPAVLDASEILSDSKKSPILSLLQEISKQTIENRKEFQAYFDEANQKFSELTDPESIPQLRDIRERLTQCLRQYYPDAALTVSWNQSEVLNIQFPSPHVSVQHRDLSLDPKFVGHGLQRATLFAVVQYLAETQAATPVDAEQQVETPLSDIILLIEEPEIFQHPAKQLLIYDAFRKITDSFNKITGIRVQVIYTTHSEKLIDIKHFNNIRVLRKISRGGTIETLCASYAVADCCNKMAELVKRKPMSDAAFVATLHIFTRELSEAFFSEKVILVEGVSDVAIVGGMYQRLGRDPRKEGIAIASVGGKSNFYKPILIFRNFGICTYFIADNDSREEEKKKERNSTAETNRRLQELVGLEEVEDFPCGAFDDFAFLDGKLEQYLKSITGDDYVTLRRQVASQFGVDEGDMTKTPALVSSFLVKANDAGHRFELLEDIIRKVDALS